MQTEALFTLLGAVLGAALAAVVAVVNTHRQIRKDERLAELTQLDLHRQQLTRRSAVYVAATYHAVLSLRNLALSPVDQKGEIEKTEVWPTVDPVNRALTEIRINDPDDLVAAAEEIDRALVTLAKAAAEEMFTHDAWRNRRTEVMGDKPERAIAVARRYVRSVPTSLLISP